ncbi:hypothetical protein GJ496_003383, partial [Pomphorhynchus laevis]
FVVNVKVLGKFDHNDAKQALEWIQDMINEEFDTTPTLDNFYNQLYNGQKLAKLANVLMPGHIKKINNGSMAFKLMENINAFLVACRDYGVADMDCFQTVDLWDRENLHQVCVTIHALGRKARKNGLKGIGPLEADRNTRQFKKEVLLEGKRIVSTQYGYNKGANQSGMNIGNTRHM